jgi:secondary thiamine-phosphate synthase enzyme
MNYLQRSFYLPELRRGFHLIDHHILQAIPEIRQYRCGLAHIFLCHTSASLTINENADPSVRRAFESFFNRAVPENESYYTHLDEGPDDLPAHLKSSILGNCLTLPVSDGYLNIGTWQGIYLCEHRDYPSPRRLIITLQGEISP